MDKRIEDFFEQAKAISLSPEEALACQKRIIDQMQGNPVRTADEACPTDQMTHSEPAFQALQNIRLSEAESQRAESVLREFMAAHPVNMAAAIAQHEKKASRWTIVTSFFSFRYAPTLAAVLVLVLGTGSLTYAADSALPGDPLYVVKVAVIEEVRATFAVTPEAKAEWNTVRAERRMNEAQALASANRLTPEVSEALAANFDMHIENANKQIERIARAGKEIDAAVFTVAVESRLRNHKDALQKIADNRGDQMSGKNISVVLRRIEHATENVVAINQSLNTRIAVNAAESGDASATVAVMMAADQDVSSGNVPPEMAMQNATTTMMKLENDGRGGGVQGNSHISLPDSFVKMQLLKHLRKRRGSGSSISSESSSSVSTSRSSSSVMRSSAHTTSSSQSKQSEISSPSSAPQSSSAKSADPLPAIIPLPSSESTSSAGLLDGLLH